MILTWTVLRSRRPVTSVPWQPSGASWWQAGRSGAGRAEAPPVEGIWWSALATWDSLDAARAGTRVEADAEAWHVVLEAASFRGSAVLAGGARPFDGLPESGQVQGAAAVVTFAGLGRDGAREREFFRRFLHLGREVAKAPGLLAASYQAPEDGAVLTFSIWDEVSRAQDWAYVQPQHAAVIARQRAHRLVQASGFLRCAVLSSSGAVGELPDPVAGRTGVVVRG